MASKSHKEFDKKRICKCGKGVVYYYNHVWELDHPPFEEITKQVTTDCPENCERLEKE